MIIAATIGTIIPILFKRFRIDPAIATGPFVTTAIDVFGLLFYFIIARIFLFEPSKSISEPQRSGISIKIHHIRRSGILPDPKS